MSEDYPGQANDRRRREIVYEAVSAADRIICDRSDGSVEETDWLTAEVAREFVLKVHCALTGRLLRYDLEQRTGLKLAAGEAEILDHLAYIKPE